MLLNIIMALANTYTVAISRIPDLFAKIRDGQAPNQLTLQLLKDGVSNLPTTEHFSPY
jgi:hypothetical protein